MHTAIHHPRRIAAAQNRFLKRIRKELRTKIPDVSAGFQGDRIELDEVFSNGRIWFAYLRMNDQSPSRHWNAFGAEAPALGRSNSITVEVNVAVGEVCRKLAGLFAVDDKTGNTVLLHRGGVGGGRKGIGKKAFLEWYSETIEPMVKFFDPSHWDKEELAILVANLESEQFLPQLESFVDAVHSFKASRFSEEPDGMSSEELKKRAAAAPGKPRASTTVGISYARNRYVAELAKRRANGKCELCGRPAPFTNASDEPYLESHHIVWLAHGGYDSPENTVALCPNCHRKMHVVNDGKDIKKLRRRVEATRLG